MRLLFVFRAVVLFLLLVVVVVVTCASILLQIVHAQQSCSFSANPELALPETGSVVSTIATNLSCPITNLRIRTAIDHTYVQDLEITLTHETATSMLWAGTCGWRHLYCYFQDGNPNIEDDANCRFRTTSPSNYAYWSPATSLVVFAGLNTAGNWTLSITDGVAGDSGKLHSWEVTVLPPVVNTSSAILAASAPQITITGAIFGTFGNNVSLSHSNSTLVPTCIIVSENATRIVCNVSGLVPGNDLYAVVSICCTQSSRTKIATIVPPPSIINATTRYADSIRTITIFGSHFSDTKPNEVILSHPNATSLAAPVCTVLEESSSAITCNLSGIIGTPEGNPLLASVISNGGSSGAPVQVATIYPVPSIQPNLEWISESAEELDIRGSFYGIQAPEDANLTLTSCNEANNSSEVVEFQLISVSDHLLRLKLERNNLEAGTVLHAAVELFEGFSDTVEVATIVPAPVVTMAIDKLANNAPILTIFGSNFATNGSTNEVDLWVNGTWVACDILTETEHMIECTDMTGLQNTVGDMVAVVAAHNGTSGSPVQVATIVPRPIVQANLAPLAYSSRFVVIPGDHFSNLSSDNVVHLFQQNSSAGVSCSLLHSETSQLHCSISGTLTSGEHLEALVELYGGDSEHYVAIASIADYTCGTDLRASGVDRTGEFDQSTCPMYASSTCCDAASMQRVVDAVTKAAKRMGPQGSCCHERGASLLCGISCDPRGSEFTLLLSSDPLTEIPAFDVFVCEAWCRESFDECKHRPWVNETTGIAITLEQHFASLNPTSPHIAYCEYFSSATNGPSYVPSMTTQPVLNVRIGTHPLTGKCFSGSQCTAPQSCGIRPDTVPAPVTYATSSSSSSICPEMVNSSCCSKADNERLQDIVALFTAFEDQQQQQQQQDEEEEEDCCTARVQSLLCGAYCHPDGASFTRLERQSLTSNVSVVHSNICPDFCNASYESCKYKPMVHPVTRTVVTMEQLLYDLYPRSMASRGEAFCSFFSTSQDISYLPSSAQPIVNIHSAPASTTTSESCYAPPAAGSATCNATSELPCGAHPERTPAPVSLSGSCSQHSGDSCCLAEEAAVLHALVTGRNAFTAMFGHQEDCCNVHVSKLLCAVSCSPDSFHFTTLTEADPTTGIANLTLHVCEDYCLAAFEACKDRPLAASEAGTPTTTLGQEMKRLNATHPHHAFCQFLSPDHGGYYYPGANLLNLIISVGDSRSNIISISGKSCFEADAPASGQCTIYQNPTTDESSSSSTNNEGFEFLSASSTTTPSIGAICLVMFVLILLIDLWTSTM